MMKNYKQNTFKKVFITLGFILMVSTAPLFSQTIEYSFANAEITNDGVDDFYEVDLMISTDTDFKYGAATLFFNYNPAAFGENLITNNKLVPVHPNGTGGTYIMDERIFGALNVYGVPFPFNSATNIFAITPSQAQDAINISTNVTVAASSNALLHIKIKYCTGSTNGCSGGLSADPMITFDEFNSNNNTFTAQTTVIPPSADGSQLTNDSYDSSGAALPVATNTWTGTTSTDWNIGTNWSLGTVPTTTSIVEIPAVTNMPVAIVDIDVASLTLLANASLTADFNIISPIFTINSGASLIAQNDNTKPTFTYHRNLPTNNWYLISSPVSGESILDFTTNNLLALGTGTGVSQNIGLAPYHNSTSDWDFYSVGQTDGLNGDDTSDVFNSGNLKGYSVKPAAPGDISFTGELIPLNRQTDISVGTGSAFNLVGNPYPSYVAINLAAASVAAENFYLLGFNGPGGNNEILTEATAWFWDGVENKYITVNNTSSARYVAPAQSFFVSAKETGHFLFIEKMQSHQATDVFNRTENTRPEIKLAIANGSDTSATDIYYIEGTTLSFDNGYDSSMFGGVSNDFTVYTHLLVDSQGQDLAIQSLPDSDFESMVIPLGVNAVSGTALVFTAESINIPNGLDVILEDRQEQTFTILSDTNTQYSVTLKDNSNGIGRFYLHTNTQATLGLEIQDLTNVSVYKTSASNLRITGLEIGIASMQLYNTLGQSVFSTFFEGASVNDVALPNLKAGIYIVDIKTGSGKLNKKIILQ